jgi:hypothetical protein
MDTAFASAKAALIAMVPLAQPLTGAILSLATDAYDSHIWAVLKPRL